MHQVKLFQDTEELNKWLADVSKKYEIVDIKFQHSPATYHRYLIHYIVK